MDLKQHIRTIQDFPKPGIQFYDISTLLAHPVAWRHCVDQLVELVSKWQPDLLLGLESRGFLPAAPLALELGVGFAMVRKAGKLPGDTISYAYDLEYGHDTVEIQKGALKPEQRIVILDDLLATGGTLSAAVSLVESVGAQVVGTACIMELEGLGGRDKLSVPFESILKFPA